MPSDITIGEIQGLEKSFSNLPGQKVGLKFDSEKNTLTKLNPENYAEALVLSLS